MLVTTYKVKVPKIDIMVTTSPNMGVIHTYIHTYIRVYVYMYHLPLNL
jgi:hypothetical protein